MLEAKQDASVTAASSLGVQFSQRILRLPQTTTPSDPLRPLPCGQGAKSASTRRPGGYCQGLPLRTFPMHCWGRNGAFSIVDLRGCAPRKVVIDRVIVVGHGKDFFTRPCNVPRLLYDMKLSTRALYALSVLRFKTAYVLNINFIKKTPRADDLPRPTGAMPQPCAKDLTRVLKSWVSPALKD